jgi:NitT/TauT family transport system substrate-binding protein
VLAKGGLKPTDVSFIGVGTSAGALSALRSGQIDAISNLDPVITMLQQKKEIRIIADARTLKDTVSVFGGPMPAASLYTTDAFLKKYPNTSQALANAMVRALKWIQKAGPGDIVKVVPETYQLGDRALYLEAFKNVREAISPDGMVPEDGPATALKALQAYEPELAGKTIDLSKTYTNELVKRANAKYK